MKLYWILFPIEDLRQAVETVKRILTKERLDKQLTGQGSVSPFMNIRDGSDRRVSFSARDELGDKINKLTVAMSRLAAKNNHEKRPFKPQTYKSRGQNRSFNHNISRIDQVEGIEDSTQVVGLDNTIRMRALEEILGDKIVEEDIEMTDIMISIEAEIGRERGYLQEIIIAEIGVQVTVDPGQIPELIQIEIG